MYPIFYPTIEVGRKTPYVPGDRASGKPRVHGVRNPSAEPNTNLLAEIASFCRDSGMAESTFGRRAVNDGKFVARLRFGGRVTTQTEARIREFIAQQRRGRRPALQPVAASAPHAHPAAAPSAPAGGPETNFRFYDNRQKYLLFVSTCGEKETVAQRVAMELDHVLPRPPALRLFDAGVGDGTVLARVMRAMHGKFPTTPFYIVGKEISLEDVRLTLDKMPDRFFEHPATVLVMTNMYYSEAPWLRPNALAAASGLVWKEVALQGSTSAEFEAQIVELRPFLSEYWTARISPTSGNPVYERPVVLVLYRHDYRFLLEPVIPRQGAVRADFDLVIASQPYRARAPVEFKASKVVAPLARALGPGGRLLGIHSYGNDPGLEIIQRVWPGENPFEMKRDELLRATKKVLGQEARGFVFKSYSDQRALFRYHMHTLPSEISSSIGTSTLMAAWNAAVYVAQIEDHRLETVMSAPAYLDATREVLQKHGKLWFLNESYVISRPRYVR